MLEWVERGSVWSDGAGEGAAAPLCSGGLAVVAGETIRRGASRFTAGFRWAGETNTRHWALLTVHLRYTI